MANIWSRRSLSAMSLFDSDLPGTVVGVGGTLHSPRISGRGSETDREE